MHGAITVSGLGVAYVAYDIHSVNDLAKDSMMVIQPRRRGKRDEELAAARIRTCVCH